MVAPFSGSVVDKPNRDRFNTQLDRQHKRQVEHQAQVAQLVEQRTENPRVGGSIPPLGTNFSKTYGAWKRVKSPQNASISSCSGTSFGTCPFDPIRVIAGVAPDSGLQLVPRGTCPLRPALEVTTGASPIHHGGGVSVTSRNHGGGTGT